jgi:hypothetical protein
MGAAFVAIAIRKERETAEAFERAGATSAERARSLDDIGVAPHGIGWRRLTDRAIVREAATGTFYLDLPSWHAARRMRRKRGLIIVALLLIFLALFYTVGPH